MASTTHSSDFRSSLPLSAAWSYVEGSFSNVVLTQGRNFIDALRAALGLSATGVWDDALQNAMIATVAGLGSSWQVVLTALQQDATDRAVRAFSLHTGIYLAYYRASNRRYDAIQLFPGTITPLWDVPAPISRGPNGIVAYDPTLDTDPAILDPTALALAVSHSTTGVRLEPGRASPSTVRIVTQESAVSALAVILLSVVVVGTIVVLTKGASREDARRYEPGAQNSARGSERRLRPQVHRASRG